MTTFSGPEDEWAAGNIEDLCHEHADRKYAQKQARFRSKLPEYFVGHQVKVRFPTGLAHPSCENCWVGPPVSIKNTIDGKAIFSATMSNHPLYLKCHRGDPITFTQDQILDLRKMPGRG